MSACVSELEREEEKDNISKIETYFESRQCTKDKPIYIYLYKYLVMNIMITSIVLK